MADLPRIFARPDLPEARLPRASAEAFGAGVWHSIGEVAAALQKQKEAQDLVAMQEAVNRRDEIYRENALKAKLEPETTGAMTADQFIANFNAQANKDDAKILEGLSPQVRKHAAVHFARLKKQSFDNHFNDYRAIYVDLNRGKIISSRDDLTQKIATARTPEDKAFYESSLNGLFAGAQKSGFFKAEEIANMRAHAQGELLAARAQRDPYGFQDEVEAGKISQGVRAADVDRALSIAERTINQRRDREQKADKGRADAAERAFFDQAINRQLDEGQLERAAGWYNWPKDKVDRIKRINLGLREGTPHGEKLVIDALAPVSKVDPTLGDVSRAEANLRNIGDKVSTDSAEYRRAVNQLRALKNSLTPGTPGNQERQLRSDARRRLNQLMMQYDVTGEPELKGKLLGDIETMPAANLKGFLVGLENQWKARQQQGAEQLKGIQGLRSLGK